MQLILNNIGSCYLLLDNEAKLLFCSDNLAELLGVENTALYIGKSISELPGIYANKAYVELTMERYRRLLSQEHDLIEEDVIDSPKYGKRLFSIVHKKVQDKEGGFRGVALIMRDITNERIIEDNRRISERLQASQLPCMVWNKEGYLVNCNKKARKLFAFTEEQSLQENSVLAIQPVFQLDGRPTEAVRQVFMEDAFSNGYAQIEILLQKTDKTPLIVEVSGVRVSWQYSHRLFVYFRDLTDVRAKEADAREAEERIKAMLDSNPMICILRNEENEPIYCNQEAVRLFGAADKEDFIDNFAQFYPKYQPDGQESAKKRDNLIQRVITEGIIKFEWMFKIASGEPLPVETTLVQIPWKGAHIFLSYSRDLRSKKANEQKMQESIRQARELELKQEKAQATAEVKNQFFASISHEIRTPMNTIIGLLELLRTENMDQQQKDYVNEMKHMSAVLLQIINDTLDFQKIESGKLPLLPIHFNLYTLFNNLVAASKVLAEGKQLLFQSSFAPDLPRLVYGDEFRVRQIITNLLTNAIKYTRQGYVKFNVKGANKDGKEFIVFCVEDSGIGIKEENISHLFDEFEQFDSHKNRGITGTGLGLAIAKRLADMMEGHIEVTSEYNKGSLFTFSFPLIKGQLDQLKHISEIKRVMAKPGTKVLVVDDNSGNITVACGLLARHGIFPHTANDGKQAIEMIKSLDYDLVFMDHMMPEMDGLEATAIIRKVLGGHYSELPIIALSANAIESAQELFIESGMTDFIAKPIDINELNRVLQKWLPQDKIEIENPAEVASKYLDEDMVSYKLLENLMTIPDLSVRDGLALMEGDKNLYIDVLWQFCKSVENDINALQSCLKNGHWEDYTIRVHALKAVFANIGNHFLADWAFSLETAAKKGDTEKCLQETASFCHCLLQFYRRVINTGIISEITPGMQKKKIDRKLLYSKLEQLLDACNDFLAETAESLVKELLNVTVNKKTDQSLQKLYDLVCAFDYDQASELIKELLL